jgi:hypothetical protein
MIFGWMVAGLLLSADQQVEIWKDTFASRHALIPLLHRARLINDAEILELRGEGIEYEAPVSKLSANHYDIEGAGFLKCGRTTQPIWFRL